ncbi:MAG: FAD-binding oxidoreductase [Rhodobacteraceae bacterium]|nr:FAD-binding oxidoreductase [Paracoccaceae bacterium]
MQVALRDYFTDRRYPESYYAASAGTPEPRPSLTGMIDTEICVIGAGFTGLSAGLHLAGDHDVTILEAARIGWGASGRNGGQIINGYSGDIRSIAATLGPAAGELARSMIPEGVNIIREFIARYGIECELRPGSLALACTGAQMEKLRAWMNEWEESGVEGLEILDRERLSAHVGSERYQGGMIDHTGGHLHPLKLALGEADSFEFLGGRLFELSTVRSFEIGDGTAIVRTDAGEVRCRTLILCGNAYLESPGHEFSQLIMPVHSEIIATEPLDDGLARQLMPGGAAAYDLRFINDYFRLSADRRMLFGSSAWYGRRGNPDIGTVPTQHMIKVFPQLADVRIDYAWSGMFAVTRSRLPQLGKLADNLFYARAYSGHGVNMSHLFGRLLAEAVDGDDERADVFARMPHGKFPGGSGFREALTTLAARWYLLRDNLGI